MSKILWDRVSAGVQGSSSLEICGSAAINVSWASVLCLQFPYFPRHKHSFWICLEHNFQEWGALWKGKLAKPRMIRISCVKPADVNLGNTGLSIVRRLQEPCRQILEPHCVLQLCCLCIYTWLRQCLEISVCRQSVGTRNVVKLSSTGSSSITCATGSWCGASPTSASGKWLFSTQTCWAKKTLGQR